MILLRVMLLPRYPVLSYSDYTLFEFVSEGPKGQIFKVVQFFKTNLEHHYEIGFGDKNLKTGLVEDHIVSNNGDRDKVLATVASTLELFFQHYPNAIVLARGRTPSRNRLYRMLLSQYENSWLHSYALYGLAGGQWLPFAGQRSLEAFLIKPKIVYL